jgi:hypothetical protein
MVGTVGCRSRRVVHLTDRLFSKSRVHVANDPLAKTRVSITTTCRITMRTGSPSEQVTRNKVSGSAMWGKTLKVGGER